MSGLSALSYGAHGVRLCVGRARGQGCQGGDPGWRATRIGSLASNVVAGVGSVRRPCGWRGVLWQVVLEKLLPVVEVEP